MTAHRTKRRRPYFNRQRLVRAAEHFLKDCFRRSRPVRAKELARSLGLSPEYLSALWAQRAGGTVHAYLRKRQLEHAAHLLRQTPLPVEVVAARSGFGTRSTLHRRFVDGYGAGPAAFRDRKK